MRSLITLPYISEFRSHRTTCLHIQCLEMVVHRIIGEENISQGTATGVLCLFFWSMYIYLQQ